MNKNQIDPKWILWAKNNVKVMKDGGCIVFPSDGAIFQINKRNKTLNLICCIPDWIGSKTELTNKNVFSEINYRYVRPNDVPMNPVEIVDKIFNNLQEYELPNGEISTLIQGIGVIFGLENKKLMELVGVERSEVMARHDANCAPAHQLSDESIGVVKARKTPINPVTFRGTGNLTVGRLWIQIDNVPDTSHRFDPSKKRGPNWDKPVTLVIWQEGKEDDISNNKSHMIVDESEFIEVVLSLSMSDSVKLWGQVNRQNDNQKMFALFNKLDSDKLKVSLYKTNDDLTEEVLVGEAELGLPNFFEGLEHLFPDGFKS